VIARAPDTRTTPEGGLPRPWTPVASVSSFLVEVDLPFRHACIPVLSQPVFFILNSRCFASFQSLFISADERVPPGPNTRPDSSLKSTSLCPVTLNAQDFFLSRRSLAPGQRSWVRDVVGPSAGWSWTSDPRLSAARRCPFSSLSFQLRVRFSFPVTLVALASEIFTPSNGCEVLSAFRALGFIASSFPRTSQLRASFPRLLVTLSLFPPFSPVLLVPNAS